MAQEKVSVDADALHKILVALVSAASPHLIREYQATMGLPGNPINLLVSQYNNYADERQAESAETPA